MACRWVDQGSQVRGNRVELPDVCGRRASVPLLAIRHRPAMKQYSLGTKFLREKPFWRWSSSGCQTRVSRLGSQIAIHLVPFPDARDADAWLVALRCSMTSTSNRELFTSLSLCNQYYTFTAAAWHSIFDVLDVVDHFDVVLPVIKLPSHPDSSYQPGLVGSFGISKAFTTEFGIGAKTAHDKRV